MNWETYIAFGDSITHGARTYQGYPELLGDQLSRHLQKDWVVVNHAVNGYKAIDLSRYIDDHFSNLKAFNSSISTILIGTNDAKEHTKPDDFRIALRQVIHKARLITMNNNVLLIHIPEFHPGIMYPYLYEMNEEIRVFNDIIRDEASKSSLRSLDLLHEPADFVDGVHLNDIGNEHFAGQLLHFILKDKGIHHG
jgi:lysophospholipase L1-like esterase